MPNASSTSSSLRLSSLADSLLRTTSSRTCTVCFKPPVIARDAHPSIRVVYIRAEKDAEAELFQSQVPTFLALTKNCKTVEVVRDIAGVPSGCGSEVLTPTTFVHVLVRVCTFQCKHAAQQY